MLEVIQGLQRMLLRCAKSDPTTCRLKVAFTRFLDTLWNLNADYAIPVDVPARYSFNTTD